MHRNVFSVDTRGHLPCIQRKLARVEPVAGLDDLEAWVARLQPAGAATIDLIGHSQRSAGCLLRLGTTLIDASDTRIAAVFVRHAATIRAGATEVRLLGCGTAASPRGRATLSRLAAILGIPVRGTIGGICDEYFDAAGFQPRYAHRLADGRWPGQGAFPGGPSPDRAQRNPIR